MFQVYSSDSVYIYIYKFFFRLFSIVGYDKIQCESEIIAMTTEDEVVDSMEEGIRNRTFI